MQDLGVDGFTQSGADSAACSSADHGAKDGASDRAQSGTGRASGGAHHSTPLRSQLSAPCRASRCRGSTGEGADGAADATAQMAGGGAG
ncbi:hypothetical protein LJR074_001848 [Acidovorax sp. LjRoot74]|uniref:hypothetical protein n=1 Tax=Acidovorax sp. LjRoot74 TaxID=3342337 RepID=UPI003ECE4044